MRHLLLSTCFVCAAAGTSMAGYMSNFDLVVLGSASTNHDVEGRAFIGGSLSGSSATFAKNLSSAAYAGVDTVLVGGAFSMQNLNLQAGNFRLGGPYSGNVNYNGGGHLITDNTVSTQVAAATSELDSTSLALSGLSANSSVSVPSGQPGPVTFTASPVGGVAVFDINASLFSNSLVQSLALVANGAGSIVVNVHGTSVNFNQGNMLSSWQTASARANTIWNFIDATTINFDRNFNGAVLAPYASLTNSTAIDGAVFVNSFTGNGEVHLPNYTGTVPAPAAPVVLGAAGFFAARRKR